MKIEKGNEILDIQGHAYRLDDLLGKGGQGKVYRLKGNKLAAKVLYHANKAQRQELEKQIAYIRRLDLSSISIAKPLEVLAPPHLGYIMKYLAGMVPLSIITRAPGNAAISEWYRDTGGLRRRLQILAKTAFALSQLHGKGLAYADPSTENIFISKSIEKSEAFLIDSDNLRSVSSAGHPTFYTPRYGAPELLEGRGVTTCSDSHAFAVIAFETLAQVHPLIGDLISNGSPELEEEAMRGKHPWIDDENDDKNRSSCGIPREIVLSPNLLNTFKLAFSKGLNHPEVRPRMTEWAEKLILAADRTVICPQCKSSTFFKSHLCGFCDAPINQCLRLSFLVWDPDLGTEGGILERGDKTKIILNQVYVSEDETVELTERHVLRAGNLQPFMPRIAVGFKGGNFTLKTLDGETYKMCSKNGEFRTEIGSKEESFKIGKSWSLHLGIPDKIRPVVTFDIKRPR